MTESAGERIRDPDRTRAELLAVATQVFAADGYAGARVDEIAARTRTTKRMIYYYFGGKEQLYLAVLEQAYLGIRGAEQALDVTDLGPVEAIREIAELTFDYHRAHPDFVRLVAIENVQRGEFARRIATLRPGSRSITTLLDVLLERGRADGAIRTDVDALDVHLLISAFCVYQVANRDTFDVLFDRDLMAPENRDRLRSMIGDVVAAWLTTH